MKLDAIVPTGGAMPVHPIDDTPPTHHTLGTVESGKDANWGDEEQRTGSGVIVPSGPPQSHVMTIAGDGKDGGHREPKVSDTGSDINGVHGDPVKKLARISTTNHGQPLPTTLLARRKSMRRLSFAMNRNVGIDGDSAVETITGFAATALDFGNMGGGGDKKEGKSVFDEKASTLPPWKIKVMKHLDGGILSGFMTVVTIWALWGDDIRLMSTWKKDDGVFVVLTWFCLFCFAAELTAASVAKPGYFNGFYFWLDFIATASLLFDIPLIWNAITGGPADEEEEASDSGGGSSAAAESTTLARAGRTSRAGTRAGRIVRLVRLIRVVKLYKQWQKAKEDKAKGIDPNKIYPEEEEDDRGLKQSKVGEKLSDLTTRRVIIGVLTMLFLLPVFDLGSGYFYTPVALPTGGIQILGEHFNGLEGTPEERVQDPAFIAAYQLYLAGVDSGVKKGPHKVSLLRFNGTVVHEDPPPHELRDDEKDSAVYGLAFARLNLRWESEQQAMLNFCRTIFICIILGAGAMLFSKDANDLVLLPIERMMKKVKDVSENPLVKQHVEEGSPEDEGMETRILENSITKICSLMAVGFGDAGAEVIAENMKQAGDLNPMVPGKKIYAIFGFCDIRQFTDTTEILQEGVMEFVNSIAKIVHLEVALHQGSANKNIGDAFLLVWKFPGKGDHAMQKELVLGNGFKNLSDEKLTVVRSYADKALASFAIIMAGLRRSQRLRRYQANPRLLERLPGYQVKMGFGLHVGWAIEGAIGSEYKVDASYLSPNVNMASRLEAATKQFGVPILVSSDFVGILSPAVRKMCRQIDEVTVKGSKQPMGLYTYDVEPEAIEEPGIGDLREPPTEDDTPSFEEYLDEYSEHPDLVAMRTITDSFLAKFAEGYDAYKRGDWAMARSILEKTLSSRVDVRGQPMQDGPSKTILDYMEGLDWKAPDSWRGFRELTEK